MPPQFFGIRVRRSPDFWLPLTFQPQVELRQSYLEEKNVYWLNMVERLKPGTEIAPAQAAVNVEFRQFLTARAGRQLSDDSRQAIPTRFVSLASGARGLVGVRTCYSQAPRKMIV